MSHELTHHEMHDHHGGATPHTVPLRLLIGVFVLLLILTGITVGVTSFDFGYRLNLVVAMAIALVKAVLVGLYFMHLRWDAPMNGFILVISLLFVTLFIGITLMDTLQYSGLQEADALRRSVSP